MRNCYDRLYSAAAAIANSAYEFSESFAELGACLLEETALIDDEESGQVLLMLGKQQFELQKIVDSYRSHISKTITNPLESVLNELRTVEELKLQSDEKRGSYECMIKRQKEKGRSKRGEAETFTYEQVQLARNEYKDEASLFLSCLKSLKQSQSRTLLTQAVRNHAAQLYFFRKALRSLETADPHVMLIIKQQNIDCEISKFEDASGDGFDDHDVDENGYDAHDYDEELSLDYGQNGTNQDVSESRKSVKLDQLDDFTFPQVASSPDASKENVYSGSQSQTLPLSSEKKVDYSNRFRKLHAHALPTPLEAINSLKASGYSVPNNYTWHSSPLERTKYEEKFFAEKELSKPTSLRAPSSVLRESNNSDAAPKPTKLLFPVAEAQIALSGPLRSKPPISTASGPICMDHRETFSRPALRDLMARADPPLSSSFPRIRELHELPRPPMDGSMDTKCMRYQSHSAPFTVTKNKSSVASPLPSNHS